MENLEIVIKLAKSKRFRMDVKAFKKSKPIFEWYAWELLNETDIVPMLRSGSSSEEIIETKKIKNQKMLVNILDLFVGSGFVEYKDGIYRLMAEPGPIDPKGYHYLQEYYPYSTRWAEMMRGAARDSLMNGVFCAASGFGGESDTTLWDGMMRESPHSFRLAAIDALVKDVKEGDRVLELGCGTGASLEEIIKRIDKPVEIVGLDSSESMLRKAKANMESLKAKYSNDSTIFRNIANIRFAQSDILRDEIPGRNDAIFMSLVLNHISEKDRPSLYSRINKALNDKGRLYVFQMIHQSKFRRNPIWMMHMVESHTEYPYRDQYLRDLQDAFSQVEVHLLANVMIASK